MTRAILIGVDIGPNLSVTGSLATILWLTALRREGLRVGAWTFLKLGALVTPPALLLAIGASLLFGGATIGMEGGPIREISGVWLYPIIPVAGGIALVARF